MTATGSAVAAAFPQPVETDRRPNDRPPPPAPAPPGGSARAARVDRRRVGRGRAVEHFVRAADGVRLTVREFPPPGRFPSPGRTLLLVHGAFEHGARYEHAARFFAARGWRTLVPDLRGHGTSGGTAMHVGRFREYVADLRRILSHFNADPARRG